MSTYSYREFLAKTDDPNSEENRSLRNIVDDTLKKAGYKTSLSSSEIKNELFLAVEVQNEVWNDACWVNFYGGCFVSVEYHNTHVNIDANESVCIGADGQICDIPTRIAMAVLSVLERMKNEEN